MVYEKFSNNQHVIRIARGERLIASLEKYCIAEKIKGAFFYGIGAADFAELAHYDVETQKYSTKVYNQALEITQLAGNMSLHEGELIIHAHGTFSDTEMRAIGGHIVDLQVSGTLEIFLTETAELNKLTDAETGLKLLDLPNTI